MNAVQKHQAIHDAAERIFSHAVEWNEGRKSWSGETVEHIIRHELEKAELNAKPSLGKRISPAGSYTLFREEFFAKHGRNPATMQTLLQAREEIDKNIKELQQ